jgi:two-component system NtrC family sensor kinase
MKFLLSILLLALLPGVSIAQDKPQDLDSLHLALKNSPSDTLRMFTLADIASYYAESERDSAMYYCEASIAKAKMLKQPIHLADFLLFKSYLVQKQSDFSQSYKLCNEALMILEDATNDNTAFIPKEWDIEPAQLRRSMTLGIFHQLGNTMVGVGNLQKAIEYFKKAVQVAEEVEPITGGMTSNMNIGSSYYQLGQLDSALIYSKKAVYKANNGGGWKAYLGATLEDIGLVYMKKAELDSAKHYFDWALQANKEQNNLQSEISIRNTLADYFKQQNQVDSMYYYASTALQFAYTLNSYVAISQSSERVAEAWGRLGNADSAYAYLAISKKLGDSLSLDRREKLLQFQNDNFEEQLRLEQEAQENEAAKNKIKTTALLAGLVLLAILVFVFYRNNRQKQKANATLESAYTNLKSTQSQLIQSEKMASLGELTAGIAHEIQNPLNFVNNFSEVSEELVDEMKEELALGNVQLAVEIADDLKENLSKINHHGKRADAIVKGMLEHSRANKGEKAPTDLNALADEFVRLSYHGLRAKDKSFNTDFKLELDPDLPKINVAASDIGRVILNLVNNAFYACAERSRSGVHYKAESTPQPSRSFGTGAEGGEVYKSLVTVKTTMIKSPSGYLGVQIAVQDNGNGIPEHIKEKIFQPFFTTKPAGSGTGLGLSLSYDIVKAHGGELKVETQEGQGTEFSIQLPITK